MSSTAHQVPLPRLIEDISAQWLSDALSIRFPGTEVLDLTQGRTVHATGTKIRLMLEYNDAGHAHRLPPTMWLKGGFEEHSDHIRNSHERESFYYANIAPLNLVNGPEGYFAGIDGTGYAVQLIEDLLARNARFGHALSPLSVDEVAAALEMLARLHAHWWRAPELAQLGSPGGTLQSDGVVQRLLTAEAWDVAVGLPSAKELPRELHDLATVRDGMERLWRFDSASDELCMVHGDAHPGNLFFEAEGRPGFLDWQRLMQCDWAHDVNYFIVSSMDPAVSGESEGKLLDHYLQARESFGVPHVNRDISWRNYCRHTIYGLIWNVVPPTMQPSDVVLEVAARFNAAINRHNTITNLRDI